MAAGNGRRVVWHTPEVTADGLKLFACTMMLLQNIGIAVVENGWINIGQYSGAGLSQALAADSRLMTLAGIGSVLQLMGGLSVPIFAFLLVEGFRNTSGYRGYLLSVAGFALISEIPYDLAIRGVLIDWDSQNALVSMTVCLLMLYFLGMIRSRICGVGRSLLSLLIVLCAIAWVTILRAQYGLCLVLLTAVFYLLYARNVWKTLLGILISLLYVTGPLAFYGIWCYNEKRENRLPKYAYYAFYPLHLLILGIIGYALRT